jgi:hypothetical protein
MIVAPESAGARRKARYGGTKADRIRLIG